MVKIVAPPIAKRIGDQGRLVWLRGLSGSGKSTWAEKWRNADPNRIFVVSLDGFREMWGIGYEYQSKQELAVWSSVDAVAETLLRLGAIVIVDSTNLIVDSTDLYSTSQGHWEQLAARCGVPCQCVDFTHVGVEECIRRNQARAEAGGKYIPEKAIRAMAHRAGLPM